MDNNTNTTPTFNLINSISNVYKGNSEADREIYADWTDEERASVLEVILTRICDDIVACNILTKEKHIDIELLLQIVSSYLIGREAGDLDENTPPPSQLFLDTLIPQLDDLPDTIEEIKETEEEAQIEQPRETIRFSEGFAEHSRDSNTTTGEVESKSDPD